MPDESKAADGQDATVVTEPTVEEMETAIEEERSAGFAAAVKDDEGDKAAAKKSGSQEAKTEASAAGEGEGKSEESPSAAAAAAEQAEKQAALEATIADVQADHADVQELLASAELRDWYDKHATEAQRKMLAEDAGASDVSRALYAFKAWKGAQSSAEGGGKDSDPRAAGAKTFMDGLLTMPMKNSDGEESTVGKVMEEMRESAPDFMAAFDKIIGRLAEEVTGLQQAMTDQTTEVQTLRFWDAVRQVHGDVDGLRSSGKVEEWAKAKGPGYLRVWQQGNAREVADLLAEAKKDIFKDAADKAKAGQREARDRRQAVSKSLLGSVTARSAPASASERREAEEEMQAGFNAAISRK